jgi:hypothetical protein
MFWLESGQSKSFEGRRSQKRSRSFATEDLRCADNKDTVLRSARGVDNAQHPRAFRLKSQNCEISQIQI